MKQYSILLAALLSILFFSSCEDYLNKPPKRIVSLQKVKDYEALLNYSQSCTSIGIYSCFLTDDVFFPDSDPNGNLSLDQVRNVVIRNFYTFEKRLFPDTSKDFDWIDSYKAISVHNTIMEGIMGAVDGTEEQKEAVYAEALLARAFGFNQLLTVYAKAYHPETIHKDPGIPLITVSDIAQHNLTRATIGQVRETIIADAEKALPMLPDSPNQNAFRGSKYAAQAFLARVYLQQGDYKKALDYAEQVLKAHPDLINLNDYELVNPNNTSGRSNLPGSNKNPESVYIRLTTFVNTMSGRAYVDPGLIDLFDKDTDRRFKLYITDRYSNKQLDHYRWAQGFDANTGIATPEIYLIAAECQARLNNLDPAIDRLEELRKNRYENYTPISRSGLTQKEALKLIFEERRRELMMIPGIRLADIKRLAYDPDFSQSVTRTINGQTTVIPPTSNKLVVAIPDMVIEFNPAMEQNSRED